MQSLAAPSNNEATASSRSSREKYHTQRKVWYFFCKKDGSLYTEVSNVPHVACNMWLSGKGNH